jgi:hypothetical protein
MTSTRKLESAARKAIFRAAQAAKAWEDCKIALGAFIAVSPGGLAPNPKRVEEVGEKIAAIQEVLLRQVAADAPNALKERAAGSDQRRGLRKLSNSEDER